MPDKKGEAAQPDPRLRKVWFDAAYDGDLERLRELAPQMPRRLTRSRGDGVTALMLAAAQERAEAVELLLPLSDPFQLCAWGRDALMHAATGGEPRCVQALLPFCNPRRADAGGLTALMLAAFHGHAEAIRLLLSASDANAREEKGGTALFLALVSFSAKEARAQSVRLLAERTDLAAVDGSGKTALEISWDNGNCRDPAVLDELARRSPAHWICEAAMARFGAAQLPRLAAELESAELEREVCAVSEGGDKKKALAPRL